MLAATTLDSSNNQFESFKSAHGKSYTEVEENYRLAVFNSNVAKIESHNADSTQTYKMGINQFTDLTQEEFEATILMAPEFHVQINSPVEDFVQVGDVNWVTEGAVT